MKYSGVEWIGEIPDKWNLVRLKDICINKKEVAGEKSSEYERLALTLNGVIKRPKDDQEGLQPKEFDTYQILEENDFVFKMIDLQNISTSRVGLSPYTGLVSPAYIRFASKKKGQFNEFIHYYLLSLWHNCVYNNIAGDGVRSALNATDMGNLKCPYPTEDQQRKIAGFLKQKTEEIDSLIDIENQQIEKLKEYKQAVITETVTRGLDKKVPLKDSGVEWIGKIPEGWNTIKIKFTSWLKGRIGWDGLKSGEFIEEGPYLITGTDFIDGGINWDTCVHISEERFMEDELLHIYENDLLITKDGTIGKLAIVKDCPEKVSLNSGVMIIRNTTKWKYLDKYLYYILSSEQFYLWYGLSQSGNSTIKHLYQGQFYDFEFTYPDLNEQKKISDYLDEKCADIDKLIEIKKQKIDQLDEYKKSLIYEYVTGKKEVC